MKSEVCRYCDQSFTPAPRKPGYIDECPVCLAARSTLPTITVRSGLTGVTRLKWVKRIARDLIEAKKRTGAILPQEKAEDIAERILNEDGEV